MGNGYMFRTKPEWFDGSVTGRNLWFRDIVPWLKENIGEYYSTWNFYNGIGTIKFVHKEHAMLFKLRWL